MGKKAQIKKSKGQLWALEDDLVEQGYIPRLGEVITVDDGQRHYELAARVVSWKHKLGDGFAWWLLPVDEPTIPDTLEGGEE